MRPYGPYGAYATYLGSQRIVRIKCLYHPFCVKIGTAIVQSDLNQHLNFRGEQIRPSKVIRNPRLTKVKPPSGTATRTYCMGQQTAERIGANAILHLEDETHASISMKVRMKKAYFEAMMKHL